MFSSLLVITNFFSLAHRIHKTCHQKSAMDDYKGAWSKMSVLIINIEFYNIRFYIISL